MRLALALAALATIPALADAQGRPQLRVERADGSFTGVGVELTQGFAAVSTDLFSELGWTVTRDRGAVSLGVDGEISISLRVGSPFFHWDGVVLQMTDAPYVGGDAVYLPLQLLTDFLPRRLPDLYEFDGPNATLRAGDPTARAAASGRGGPAAGRSPSRGPIRPGGSAPVDRGSQEAAGPDDPAGVAEPDGPAAAGPYSGPRVVVIDAGHGGADPGAMGPSGIREKDVALGVALGIAEILRRQPLVEVYLTRDDDTFVDIWERGEIATGLKGDKPGIFVSIHANSFPQRRSATGFETYFLSEARTEHERRVSAIENAPVSLPGNDVDPDSRPDLDFILRELRNLNDQHWSADLAGVIQEEIDDFHPGPNRGVKQAVLAVLTNALMPSVLVELGYLSNQNEGRLLGESSFQADAADAIATAVLRFFERYPPGSDFGGREQP